MAATHVAGLKGRGRSTSSIQGRKAKLSQHAQELRTIIASQGAAPWVWRGRPRAGGGLSVPPSSCVVPTAPSCPPEQEKKSTLQFCEEELHQKRELLPRLREAVRDIRAPSGVQKVPACPACCAPACAGPAEPAPPPLLSRSRQHRAARECDRPQVGSSLSRSLAPAQLLAVPACMSPGLPGFLQAPAASLGERSCLCPSLPVPRL